MSSSNEQLSLSGKITFIIGGIALLIITSTVIEYVLKRAEIMEDYDQYADIEDGGSISEE